MTRIMVLNISAFIFNFTTTNFWQQYIGEFYLQKIFSDPHNILRTFHDFFWNTIKKFIFANQLKKVSRKLIFSGLVTQLVRVADS